jgi:uncharacterized RDD family membrane protein YckC
VQPPTVNPYAPPQAELGLLEVAPERQILANAGTRFVAKFIDQMMFFALLVVGLLAITPTKHNGSFEDEQIGLAILASAVAPILLCSFQWYLIATTGRSLGKRWLGIKIVKTDGSRVNFVSGVVLRAWVPFAIAFFPCIGGLFSIVDALSVFRDDRRCLHDQFAGTKVIEAR